MNNCLIGFTGFVGSSLLRQTHFQSLYRSTNIDEIQDKNFQTIVCAGVSAQKWIANKDPAKDLANIDHLIANLKSVKCKKFVLISTIDVFSEPYGVDEDTIINEVNLHPYGLHRLKLEKFVQEHFSDFLIIRLPGLVGPGLRKNIIFDFLNENNIHAIDTRGVFQFYPMVNLWYDIQFAINAGLRILHLVAEPISVSDVFKLGFGKSWHQELQLSPASYDVRSRYARQFSSSNYYMYNLKDTIQAIRCYAQTEPRIIMPVSGESV